ncbi:MAG: hypothetical protein JST22_16070 [Bacteroidetes bacterium]|nr:hypothetical protein [Bacteroidota bacterium]
MNSRRRRGLLVALVAAVLAFTTTVKATASQANATDIRITVTNNTDCTVVLIITWGGSSVGVTVAPHSTAAVSVPHSPVRITILFCAGSEVELQPGTCVAGSLQQGGCCVRACLDPAGSVVTVTPIPSPCPCQ